MKAEFKEKLILAIKENGNFEPEDFSITEKSYQTQVTISYEYSDDGYSFSFKIPNSTTTRTYQEYNKYSGKVEPKTRSVYLFEGTMQPGAFATKENFEVDSFNQLLSLLDGWLTSLNKELLSLPVQRRLDEQDSKIKEVKDKIDALFQEAEKQNIVKNDYLTREEGEVLRQRLEEVESILKEKIEADKTDEEQKNKEIEELKADFEKLKSSAEILKKKSWIKRFAVTLTTWSTDPEKQKRLANGIKLIENVGQALGLPMPKISGLLITEGEKKMG